MSSDAPCPICRQASQRLFQVSAFWIRQCLACRHRFAEINNPADHIEQQYADSYFTKGGAGYAGYLRDERLLVARGRWYARRLTRFCQPGVVCDIGAAAGFTLVGFREAGWTAIGIEPNATMARYAQERFGLHVDTICFEAWHNAVPLDLVSMIQVLPHLFDPAGAVEKAAQLVRPGGHLLIETWDRESRTARLFGKSWHEYSPPSVLHWFSRADVANLARRAGFEQVAGGRPSKWISAAHAKSVLKHKAETSITNRIAFQLALLVPDNVAIPYVADDLFWALFRRRESTG